VNTAATAVNTGQRAGEIQMEPAILLLVAMIHRMNEELTVVMNGIAETVGAVPLNSAVASSLIEAQLGARRLARWGRAIETSLAIRGIGGASFDAEREAFGRFTAALDRRRT
jgi:hypothetical protein